MKLRANTIVKLIVGTTAAATILFAAGSFTATNVVFADENSDTYQQTEKFVADDGKEVTIYESETVTTSSENPNTTARGERGGGLGTAELIIVDDAS